MSAILDYDAAIYMIDARRPGFARVIMALIKMADRTGRIDDDLAEMIHDDEVTLASIEAIIEARLDRTEGHR